MGKIVITFIVVELFALIGYYLGRFLAPFLINKYTIKFIKIIKLSPDIRTIQIFASAGSGAFAAFGVRIASALPYIDVSIGLWLFTCLVVIWFSAASGFTGRFRCGIISYFFYWIVYVVLF